MLKYYHQKKKNSEPNLIKKKIPNSWTLWKCSYATFINIKKINKYKVIKTMPNSKTFIAMSFKE